MRQPTFAFVPGRAEIGFIAVLRVGLWGDDVNKCTRSKDKGHQDADMLIPPAGGGGESTQSSTGANAHAREVARRPQLRNRVTSESCLFDVICPLLLTTEPGFKICPSRVTSTWF